MCYDHSEYRASSVAVVPEKILRVVIAVSCHRALRAPTSAAPLRRDRRS